MNTFDRDGPPDGDFARYIENLGSGAKVPGRVSPTGAAARRARSRADPGAAGGATTSAEAAGRHGLAEEARRALKSGAGRTGAQRGANPAGEALRATGRSAARRLSRWLAIGGVALIAAALLDLFPDLSPLPGFVLLGLSIVLRKLSTQ